MDYVHSKHSNVMELAHSTQKWVKCEVEKIFSYNSLEVDIYICHIWSDIHSGCWHLKICQKLAQPTHTTCCNSKKIERPKVCNNLCGSYNKYIFVIGPTQVVILSMWVFYSQHSLFHFLWFWIPNAPLALLLSPSILGGERSPLSPCDSIQFWIPTNSLFIFCMKFQWIKRKMVQEIVRSTWFQIWVLKIVTYTRFQI